MKVVGCPQCRGVRALIKKSRLCEELLDKVLLDDIESSATLRTFKTNTALCIKVVETLSNLLPPEKDKMLDLGCGYGGLTMFLKNVLGFSEAYGVDQDCQRLSVAKERGLKTYECDLEGHLPFAEETFELVTSFGVLEHLKFYDNVFREACRVLKVQGSLLISTTNLGSWANRVALLFGYQPRNIEVSRLKVVGVHKAYHELYTKIEPIGHISSCTMRALKELMKFHGLRVERVLGASDPYSKQGNFSLLKTLDVLLSKKPSLSTRVFIFAQRRY